MFFAVLFLITTGDYQGWMSPYLGEEDSWMVGALLSMVGL